jgi:hypothetical protein
MSRFIALAGLAISASACTSTPTIDVPDTLKPTAGETVVLTSRARGVQIYECRARKDGAGFEWAFVAPEAELFDARSRSIGHHGAGPSWEAVDGSRVVGSVKARADAPVPGAVPWLLLSAKSTGFAGAFAAVTSIQRVNTAGGVAPATPCNDDLKGTTVRVPYTADYVFYAAR